MLGLLATIPIGITLGSLLPNPRFIPLVLLPFGALTAISGIFYPITHLPGWLQGIGQLFPMYWLGLGMRAALLPLAPGRGRDRRVVAVAACVPRAHAVGGARAHRRAAGAAPDGAARIGVAGGRSGASGLCSVRHDGGPT